MKQVHGIYKASNVFFDPNTMEARSYGWWVFVKRIKGRVVFNVHRYSNTTARHQWKVRMLMKDLGINIDLHVNTPKSLEFNALPSCIAYHKEEIERLFSEIHKRRSKAQRNVERREEIAFHNGQIEKIKLLMKGKL